VELTRFVGHAVQPTHHPNPRDNIASVSERAKIPTIRFEATPYAIDEAIIVRLSEQASRRLPSRGQVAARCSINGVEVQTVVEPDGAKGHWIKVDQALRRSAGISAGETVKVALEATREWPEPEVPPDLAAAISAAPDAIRDMWHDITPMARWEWVRWVNATANPATRQRRVDVTISKMKNGKRRPCCFDSSACTDPAVSRNGKLRDQS
jgi:hypothetical protein